MFYLIKLVGSVINMNDPIFIFSLPRSGSTLLQRMLLTHPKIGGTAETWLLLPIIYSIKEDGMFTEYNHKIGYQAIKDFIDELPNKKKTYLNQISIFVKKLYEQQLKEGEIFFLDKTPRYYLIIHEIFELFPNAKYIFLFRNPIEIMSSIMNTWTDGRLKFTNYYIDLMIGPKKLSLGYEEIDNKAISIQYEDILFNTEYTLRRIFNYLEIEYVNGIEKDFKNIHMSGRMGDKKGTERYSKIEKGTINKWKDTFNTKRKKKYLEQYIKKIGSEIIESHGYNYNNLLKQIDSLKPKKLGYLCDNYDLFLGNIQRFFEYNQFKRKVRLKLENIEKPFLQHM